MLLLTSLCLHWMVRKKIILGAWKILRKLPAVLTILTIYLFIYLFSSAQSLMSNQVRSAPSSVSGWGGNHYFQNQARCRLDARLWLTCRLALARGPSRKRTVEWENLAAQSEAWPVWLARVCITVNKVMNVNPSCRMTLNSYSWDCWRRQGFWQIINNLLAGLRVNCWQEHRIISPFISIACYQYLSFNKFEGHKFISFIITVTCLPSLNNGFTLPYLTKSKSQ